jgi:hypothetical protein
MAVRRRQQHAPQVGRLREHPNVTTFAQHGFKPDGESGDDNVVGNCIFCDGNRFFVNVETKKWDCKHCHRKGGFLQWLAEVAQFCEEAMTRTTMQKLVDSRGISAQTFRKFKVGYNPHTDRFVIPIFDVSGSKVWDIRVWDGKKILRSTKGCTAALMGWEQLSDRKRKVDRIWLCEGEWDYLAMREVLTELKSTTEIAVGVQGAGTFKSEWYTYFKDRNLFVAYDNDHTKIRQGVEVNAAQEGSAKVYNALKGIVRDIRFVHWPESYADGFDVRDYYIDHDFNADSTIRALRALMNPLPPGAGLGGGSGDDYEDSAPTFTGKGLTVDKLYDTFRDWLYLPDTTVLDVLFGTAIANRLPGDPLWLFFVAKSGGVKSTLIMAMAESPGIYSTTTLTPPSLISGHPSAGGGDPSLIPQFDQHVVTIKDFTTILTANPNARDEIFGILRDAYDGRIEKSFGNGVIRSYESQFGIIAGVTPAIELFTEGHTALGERFIQWRMPAPQDLRIERDLMNKALDNTTFENEMHADFTDVSKAILDFDFGAPPELPDDIRQRLLCLAQYTAVMRGTINRDRYSKEVTHKPFTEIGTRLTKQLYKLMIGIGQLHRHEVLGEFELEAARQVAVSSAPSRMEEAVHKMYAQGYDRLYTTQDMCAMIDLPILTVGRVLENLNMLRIVRKVPVQRGIDAVGSRYVWRLHEQFVDLLREGRVYDKKSKTPARRDLVKPVARRARQQKRKR